MKQHAEINKTDNQPMPGNNFFGSKKTWGARAFIQPKLTINDPNDEDEKEADNIADKVMRMQQPFVQTKPLPITSVQQKCAHCEEEEKKAQRKEMNDNETTGEHSLDSYVGKINSSGQSLPGEVRSFYEPRFGYDFSNVKVHTDSVAAKSAQSINALAYTSGNNIVFNSGQYSPATHGGKHLLAHELTHVIQQESSFKESANGSSQKGKAPEIQRLVKRAKVTGCDDQSESAFSDIKAAEQAAFTLLQKGIKRIELALAQYAEAVHENLIPSENDLKKFEEALKVGKHFRTAFGLAIDKSATWDFLRIVRARFMGTLSYLNSVYFDYVCCENDETCSPIGAHQCKETRFAITIAENDPNLIILCPLFWSSTNSKGHTLAHEILHLWGRGLIKDTTVEVFGIERPTPRTQDANRYEKFLRLLNN